MSNGSLLALSVLLVCCHGTASQELIANPMAPEAEPDPMAPDPMAPDPGTPLPSVPPSEVGDHLSFFLSGHSLTDDPLADFVVNIARRQGLTVEFNEQIIVGSPIRVRTRGMGSSGWSGYRDGKNREGGSGLDIIDELRSPSTVSRPYDALVLTERHDLVSVIQWEDTVRFARHFHDRLTEGNPAGTTYVYSAWLGVSDLDDPTAWIRYERAADPVWQCIATRVQTSLNAEGSRSHVSTIPMGAAVAELLERALADRVPSLAASTPRGVMQRLFADDVHLTREGVYFTAAFVFAHLFHRSPQAPTPPATVDAALARELEAIAWELAQRSLTRVDVPTLGECRAMMRDSFCRTFWEYQGRPSESGSCEPLFAESNRQGPFFFDVGSDESYWFSAP